MDRLAKQMQNFDLDRPEHRQTIRDIAAIILPKMDDILSEFYDWVMASPDMAAYFSTTSLLEHAKHRQAEHWKMLLAPELGEAYLRSAQTIGEVHFRIKLPFDHYIAAYARVGSHLTNILFDHAGHRGSRDKLCDQVTVLNRLLSLDTELVIDAYFNAKQDEISVALSHLTDGIEELSLGHLDVYIPSPDESDFPRAYGPLRTAFNAAAGRLNDTLSQVDTTASKMGGIVNSLTRGAAEVAQRSSQQAAALEQTAAAMHELTESVRSAAEHADESNKIVQAASITASEQGQTVKDAMTAMHEVDGSFKEITNIMKVIDDISFQTNLLALNAGVEAARAGEAGRGFAVVASEVRNLAVRASQAASEINALISKSASHVGTGVTLVNKTGDALKVIVEDINRVSGLVNDMSGSSRDQARGLQEINSAVAELDKATQTNASVADQTRENCVEIETVMSHLIAELAKFELNPDDPDQSQAA